MQSISHVGCAWFRVFWCSYIKWENVSVNLVLSLFSIPSFLLLYLFVCVFGLKPKLSLTGWWLVRVANNNAARKEPRELGGSLS